MSSAYHLRGVRFSYGGGEPPLVSISEWDFEAGGLHALVGSNGAGKSTLLHLLAFLDRPDSGALSFLGAEVHDGNRARCREQVGLVPQNPYLLRGSVEYNLELGLRFRGMARAERKERCQAIIEQLKLPARPLSGGEGQKVALGRVLVLEPRVLLLDEPFTWLDAQYTQEFSTLLRHLCTEQGVTVLYTSHDHALAKELSDRIHVLSGGDLGSVPTLAHGKSGNMQP